MASNKTLIAVVVIAALVIPGIILAIIFGTGGDDQTPTPEFPITASALMILANNASIMGTLSLAQTELDGSTRITGTLTGLAPNMMVGFHIHTYGDLGSECASTGGHYNPFGLNHGGPDDEERHVGDLGLISADSVGTAVIDITDRLVSLNGVYSVLGRAFVVHMGEDDLGQGGDDGSLATGNAGGRAACGIIVLVDSSS